MTEVFHRVETEGRKLTAIAKDLNAQLSAHPSTRDMESSVGNLDWEGSWPESYRWIACFAVRGDSEGWYVHVDAIGYAGMYTRKAIFQGKTFDGMDHAYRVAAACAVMLDA